MTNRLPSSYQSVNPTLKSLNYDLDQVRSTSSQRTGPFSLNSPRSHKVSVQRINQIKPKPKINIPTASPKIPSNNLASSYSPLIPSSHSPVLMSTHSPALMSSVNSPMLYSSSNSPTVLPSKVASSNSPLLLQPTKHIYLQPESVIQQLPVLNFDQTQFIQKQKKPRKSGLGLFDWLKPQRLCGFGVTIKKEQSLDGCTCARPCEVRQMWVGSQQLSDKSAFVALKKHRPLEQNLVQIKKDQTRTYSGVLAFTTAKFRDMLEQILVIYSVYDMKLGYVQGINTLAAILLYHIKNAQDTFWALVDLMEYHQLRLNYIGNMAALQQHCQAIDQLVKMQLQDLYKHIQLLGVDLSTLLHGWVLTLMGKIVPLQDMHLVLNSFRQHGWKFIYRLVLSFLNVLKQGLMLAEDDTDFFMTFSNENCGELGLQWPIMIQSATPKQKN